MIIAYFAKKVNKWYNEGAINVGRPQIFEQGQISDVFPRKVFLWKLSTQQGKQPPG